MSSSKWTKVVGAFLAILFVGAVFQNCGEPLEPMEGVDQKSMSSSGDVAGDQLPSLTVESLVIAEGTKKTILIRRTGSDEDALYLNWELSGEAREFFVKSSGSVTILPNQMTSTIELQSIDNSQRQGDLVFDLTVSDLAGKIEPGVGKISLRDNESTGTGTYNISSSNINVAEGQEGSLIVRRSGDVGPKVILSWEVDAAGSKYFGASSGTVIMASGVSSVSFPLKAIDDNVNTGNLSFSVSISDNSGIAQAISTTVVFVDNETSTPPAGNYNLSSASLKVREGSTDNIIVNRTGDTTSDINISWQIEAAGANYFQKTIGTVVMAANRTSISIPVVALENNAIEGDKNFKVIISDLSTKVAPFQITLTHLDNEGEPSLSIASNGPVSEGSQSIFNLSLSKATFETVSVLVQTQDGTAKAGTDYQKFYQTYNFAPGETSKTVKVTTYDNQVSSGDKSFSVVLSNPSHAQIAKFSATATINDNDLAMIKTVATGDFNSCMVHKGAAYCWGENNYMAVGDGTADERKVPTLVSGLESGVTMVSSGAESTCAIKDKKLFCWGRNNEGQLGNGDVLRQTKSVPVPVNGLQENVQMVDIGPYHACAIKNNALYCWGYNKYGQLGDGATKTTGSTSSRLAPYRVPGFTQDVTQVSVGGYQEYPQTTYTRTYSTTCAIKAGAAYCWGYGYDGQLGNGLTGNAGNSRIPEKVSGLDSGVTKISTNGLHACAIHNGAVKCWGRNFQGEVGAESLSRFAAPHTVISSGAVDVKSGKYHTCALLNNGGVKCWGWGDYGRLGDGVSRKTAVTVPVQVVGLTSGVSELSVGNYHACVNHRGTVKCWGYNKWANLGDGTKTIASEPKAVLFSGN